jgi:hypothetical protein
MAELRRPRPPGNSRRDGGRLDWAYLKTHSRSDSEKIKNNYKVDGRRCGSGFFPLSPQRQ